MHEKSAKVLLTSWTIVGCALEVLAPLVYVYLWHNKLCYQILLGMGLMMITLRIILAGASYLAAVSASNGKKPEPTAFLKFNTRQAKWSMVIVFILMALNLMFVHV